MKPEQRFWDRLRDILGPAGHFVRVENLCDPGTPDVNFAMEGVDGWVELKYRDRLPLTDQHGVRQSQKLWIKRRLRYGGLVILAIGVSDRVYFVPGRFARDVNDWRESDFQRRGVLRADLGNERAVLRCFRSIMGKRYLIYVLKFRDGRVYVGMSSTWPRRFRVHQSKAKRSNRPLYAAWREQGAPEVKILRAGIQDRIEALQLEATTIQQLKASDPRFGLNPEIA